MFEWMCFHYRELTRVVVRCRATSLCDCLWTLFSDVVRDEKRNPLHTFVCKSGSPNCECTLSRKKNAKAKGMGLRQKLYMHFEVFPALLIDTVKVISPMHLYVLSSLFRLI